MIKKVIFSFIAFGIILLLCFLTFMFMMRYEPVPSKSEVERLVDAKNLKGFGDVEGSYLYTPRNYGYFSEKNLYIVEKSLGELEQYNDQYVVIKPGLPLKEEAEAIEKELGKALPYENEIKVHSRHQVIVFKGGEKVREEVFFKVTSAYQGKYYLSFVSPGQEERFNFSTRGYEEFLEF